MFRRHCIALCQKGGDSIYGLIGEWGYRENHYSIQMKNGKAHYKEEYPNSVRGIKGVEGPIEVYDGEQLGVPEFDPEFIARLWREDGTIYFEKDGDVVKAVFCQKGVSPVNGLKSKATRIESLRSKNQKEATEMFKRAQERRQHKNSDLDRLKFYKYSGLFCIFMAIVFTCVDNIDAE